MSYAKCLFTREEVIEKADEFGLTAIENEDLTLAGLIAKMIQWDEGNHGVEAYIYDMTKTDIENLGGKMPEDIRRIEDEPVTFNITCPCQTVLMVADGTTIECHNCHRELDDKGNVL